MTHLDFLTLADYWIGEDRESPIEEHLFACAECSEKLEWIARISEGIRSIVKRGDLAWVMTPEFLARLTQEGLRVRSYLPENGGAVQCTVTSEDDLLLGRLRSDLSGVSRLDALLFGREGLRMRLEDLAFRPRHDSELVFNQPITAARAMDTDHLVVRLVAVEPDGERIVGEFTFNHFRTLSGTTE